MAERKKLIEELQAAKPTQEVDRRPLMEFPTQQTQQQERGFLEQVMRPQNPEEISNQRTFLAGATPLLVGLLAGDVSAGAEVASKGLIGEDIRRQKEQKSLLDYMRKTKATTAKAPRYQRQTLESGQLSYFDPSTGKYHDPTTREEIPDARGYQGIPPEKVALRTEAREKVKQKYNKKLTKDAEGRPAVYRKSDDSLTPIKGDFPREFTPRQTKQIEKSMDKFDSRSDVKDARKGLDAAEKFMEAVKIAGKNPVAGKYAIFALAKSADSGGRLSDQDVAMFGGSKALRAQVKQAAQTAAKGTLTGENLSFMTEIARTMMKTSRNQLNAKAKKYSKRRSKLIGTNILPFIQEENGAEEPRNIDSLKKDLREKGEEGLKDSLQGLSLDELRKLQNSL